MSKLRWTRVNDKEIRSIVPRSPMVCLVSLKGRKFVADIQSRDGSASIISRCFTSEAYAKDWCRKTLVDWAEAILE